MRNKGWLIGFVVFQALILVLMVLKSMLPLVWGDEVVLVVRARDPRDIFRGNYVDLRYDFSNWPVYQFPNNLPDEHLFTYGDVLFAELQKEGKTWKTVGLWIDNQPRKEGNLTLKVIVQSDFFSRKLPMEESSSESEDNSFRTIQLAGGIESYFSQKERALEIEQSVRENFSENDSLPEMVRVKVRIGKNGEGRIKEILLP